MSIDQESAELTICPSCGEGNEKKSGFCIYCGNPLRKRRGTQTQKRYPFLLMLIIIFIVGGFFFWRWNLESKLVGRVNGEGISQKEFSKRVERIKKFYERRYSQGIFSGKTGKANLNQLKNDILEEMVAEKILLQEAKKAGYSSAPEGEIEKQLKAIKEKYGLSDNDFKEKMGISIGDLKEELRKGWIISNFIEKAVLKGNSQNGQVTFTQWFSKTKEKARIETYEKFKPGYVERASCCNMGCGGGKAQPLDPEIERDAKSKALEYYEKKTQKKGAEARVTNYGCHIQVDIVEDGKVILSLTYNGREVQEI